MSAIDINTTDKTGCPIMELTFEGKTVAELDELSSTVTDYTDGYNLKLKITFGEFSVATLAGDAGLCFGTDLTGNNNSAPNGAYCMQWAV